MVNMNDLLCDCGGIMKYDIFATYESQMKNQNNHSVYVCVTCCQVFNKPVNMTYLSPEELIHKEIMKTKQD